MQSNSIEEFTLTLILGLLGALGTALLVAIGYAISVVKRLFNNMTTEIGYLRTVRHEDRDTLTKLGAAIKLIEFSLTDHRSDVEKQLTMLNARHQNAEDHIAEIQQQVSVLTARTSPNRDGVM